MNKVIKYILYVKKTNLLSTNLFLQYNVIQRHAFSTRISTSIYFPSCIYSSLFIIHNIFDYNFYQFTGLKTIRHASNTGQSGYSNTLSTNDVLLTSIFNAKKTSDVLEMLRLHNSVMTTPQHLQALHSLFTLHKTKR